MTQFPILPSPSFRRWTLCLIAITVLSIVLLSPVWWLTISLSLALIVVVWWLWLKPSTKNPDFAAVIHDQTGWHLLDTQQQLWSIEWCDGSVVTPYFLAMRWRRLEQKKQYYLLLWHDALSVADYRHFCRLYWFDKVDSD